MLVIIILIVVIINFASLCLMYNLLDNNNNKEMESLKVENIRLLDILTEMEKDLKKMGEK